MAETEICRLKDDVNTTVEIKHDDHVGAIREGIEQESLQPPFPLVTDYL